MPIELLAGGALAGVVVGAATIYVHQLHSGSDADRDENTIAGVVKALDGEMQLIRRKSSAEDVASSYGRMSSSPSSSPPSSSLPTKQLPIFSYGEVAGISVLLPDGDAVAERGLAVTQVLAGQWAESCGARVGDIVTAIDGRPVHGLSAREIRRIVNAAKRPLWLDLQSPRRRAKSPTSWFSSAEEPPASPSGAHLLL
mmetsp:Transcript_25604/g.76880  ORF Transcript_25604/g.76880 Transcript_25604/m.76880 type:complete len:198 (+) Transcript_25604:129-722(+)